MKKKKKSRERCVAFKKETRLSLTARLWHVLPRNRRNEGTRNGRQRNVGDSFADALRGDDLVSRTSSMANCRAVSIQPQGRYFPLSRLFALGAFLRYSHGNLVRFRSVRQPAFAADVTTLRETTCNSRPRPSICMCEFRRWESSRRFRWIFQGVTTGHDRLPYVKVHRELMAIYAVHLERWNEWQKWNVQGARGDLCVSMHESRCSGNMTCNARANGTIIAFINCDAARLIARYYENWWRCMDNAIRTFNFWTLLARHTFEIGNCSILFSLFSQSFLISQKLCTIVYHNFRISCYYLLLFWSFVVCM